MAALEAEWERRERARAAAAAAEPQAIGGWASAYGDCVRCPQCSRPYDKRHHDKCPACTGGALAFIPQYGRPAAGAGIGGGRPAGKVGVQ